MSTFADQLRNNYRENQVNNNQSEFNGLLEQIKNKESLVLRKKLDPSLAALFTQHNLDVTFKHFSAYDCGCDMYTKCHGCYPAYDETTIVNLPHIFEKLKSKLLEVSKSSPSYVLKEKLHPLIKSWLLALGVNVSEKDIPGRTCSCDWGCPGCSVNSSNPYTESTLTW